jgi:hypothetical protein
MQRRTWWGDQADERCGCQRPWITSQVMDRSLILPAGHLAGSQSRIGIDLEDNSWLRWCGIDAGSARL